MELSMRLGIFFGSGEPFSPLMLPSGRYLGLHAMKHHIVKHTAWNIYSCLIIRSPCRSLHATYITVALYFGLLHLPDLPWLPRDTISGLS